jgi:hypothetical protein
MPGDLALLLARQRKARSDLQNDVTVLSPSFIAALAAVMLLAVSDKFAEVMALLGLY